MYYEIYVASQRYHKDAPLTYMSNSLLDVGSLVTVPLQQETALGIVTRKIGKPRFATKPVLEVIATAAITPESFELLSWLKLYYPSPAGLMHGLLAPSYLKKSHTYTQDSIKHDPITASVTKLNDEQTAVIKATSRIAGHSVMLHGDTGSGKTRVYVELARQSLLRGKSVIVLTPEIGLTAQLVKNLVQVFGDRVIVMHSELTTKQRLAAWMQVAGSTEPVVVVGPRSTLFAPLKSVGLIVVDEMHDNAYKQEQAPYYVTTRVAAKLGEIWGSKVIFGSATPSIQDYYIFKNNDLPILRMTNTATGNAAKLDTVIVDLKSHQDFTKSKWLSNTLVDNLAKALKNSEQSLVFLNRRGTARIIMCQNCGLQSSCPHCDLPLTYHGDKHSMSCHTCGYSTTAPSSCPTCKSSDIIFKCAGTKSIVTELERLFPKAVIRRFDSDVKKADHLNQSFADIVSGKIDILVGTQMLSKGLDLPKLSVVGIVQADTALNFPDYTAEERTYQMLNQVVGRVGRGHIGGTIILQTHHPESELIKQALRRDYDSFYQQQLDQRQKFNFPPFCYLLKLTCERKSDSSAKSTSQDLANKIVSLGIAGVEVIGPNQAFIPKISDKYRWQLTIKSIKRSNLTQIIGIIPSGWNYDIDPTHLL